MIGKLKGVIDSYGEDHVILDVHGVGYVVLCSAKTLTALAAGRRGRRAVHRDAGARGRHPPVRLPHATRSASGSACCRRCRASARRWRSACSPSWIPAALATAIGTQDKAMVARAPGVGPKLAARIVAELKDKAPAFGQVDPRSHASPAQVEDRSAPRPVHGCRLRARQSRLCRRPRPPPPSLPRCASRVKAPRPRS